MSLINQLQTIARAVTPIAFNVYDQERGEQRLLDLLARTVPGVAGARRKEHTLEWAVAFPEMRQWIGERKTQRVFKGGIPLAAQAYEVTMGFDRRDLEIDGGGALFRAENLAPAIAQAFARGRVLRAYEIVRDNAASYDGQDFFDTEHVHPHGGSYSNLLRLGADLPARQDAATPTPKEVREEIKVAMDRLIRNTIIRNHLRLTDGIAGEILVITRTFGDWKAFSDLRSEERIEGDINRFRNTFQIAYDLGAPAGVQTSYDVIHAIPGGPRPTIFVPVREPRGLQFDLAAEFSQKEIPFGMHAYYMHGAGFPQTAVRIEP